MNLISKFGCMDFINAQSGEMALPRNTEAIGRAVRKILNVGRRVMEEDWQSLCKNVGLNLELEYRRDSCILKNYTPLHPLLIRTVVDA